MVRSFLIDLDDPRMTQVAEAMANPTCKKILGLLAEKDMSVSDLAKELKSPLNTIDYNVKKLVAAGLVQALKYQWSVKGKKILRYTVAHKRIVISPKSRLKGVLPTIFLVALAAVGIKFWNTSQEGLHDVSEKAMAATQTATSYVYDTSAYVWPAWLWFTLGSLFVLIALWAWQKMK